MAGSNTLEFTDANFEQQVLQSDKPVVVDLWADWCAPCKALAPTIDRLADELAGTIRIGKLNTTDNSEVPTRYGISAIPTLLLFQNGKEVGRIVGAKSAADLKREFAARFGVSV